MITWRVPRAAGQEVLGAPLCATARLAAALLLCSIAVPQWLHTQNAPANASKPRDRTVQYASADSARARWRLSPRPLVSIGGADGTGPTEFATVVGVLRLNDGRLVVADAGSKELRYFDGAGRFLQKRGGPGRGPGEMQGLEGLFLATDTLVALDSYGGARLYTVQGAFLRTLPFRMGPSSAFGGLPVGVVRNSGLVGLQRQKNWQRRTAGLDSQEVRVLRAGERVPVTIATLPAWRTFQHANDPYPRPFAFATWLQVAAFQHEICTSFTATYDVVCLDIDGRPTRTIRRAVPQRAVTDSMKRAWRDGAAGRLPGGGSRYEGSLRTHRENVARTSEFMPTLPAIARLVASRTGELWVADYQPSDGIPAYVGGITRPSAGPSRWNVFDAESRWIGTLSLPARFWLFDAGPDWVAGIARDEDDLERVEVWRVERR